MLTLLMEADVLDDSGHEHRRAVCDEMRLIRTVDAPARANLELTLLFMKGVVFLRVDGRMAST